jgi:sigma-E factor negative regulatory protein RseB
MTRWPFAALAPFLAALAAAQAHAGPGADPLAWLSRAASSAAKTTYSGTVVQLAGERTITSRITHVFFAGSEHEKIESLDGPRHEIVRHNEDLQCFYPDSKTIRLDRRVTARFFPSLLHGAPEAIAESYDLRLGEVERVLGQDCRWIHLDPKDALRFAQRLCAGISSGLLLRAKTLGPSQQVLEEYSFTALRLGPDVSRGEVRSTFFSLSKDWRTDREPREEVKEVSTGWIVAAPPPGFRKVAEMLRKLPGRAHPVSQLVYSDGIATLSVFVEPMSSPPRSAEATNEDADLSVFVRPMGEHLVTVLGEVPPAAVQQVGRSVARRP